MTEKRILKHTVSYDEGIVLKNKKTRPRLYPKHKALTASGLSR